MLANEKKLNKFASLLRYQFSSMGRVLLPIYAATLIVGIITGIFIKIQDKPVFSDVTIVGVFFVICAIAYAVLIMAAILLGYFFSITRFKKSMLETEGYLMHTLPVTAEQNILANAITAVVYQILGIVTAGISGIFIMLICANFAEIEFYNLFNSLMAIIRKYAGQIAAYTTETIVLSVISLFTANFMFYASLAIGHSFNGKRVFKSICAFVGFYIISQIINFNLINPVINFSNSFDSGNMHAVLIPVTILEAVYGAVYFIITTYFIKNKLNLH